MRDLKWSDNFMGTNLGLINRKINEEKQLRNE